MEPTVEVQIDDMHDEATIPTPNPVFPSASQLRREFFSDLDASSRVNPNRRRQQMVQSAEIGMEAMRTIMVGAMRDDSPPATEPDSLYDCSTSSHLHRVERSAEAVVAAAAPRRSVNPREDFGEEELEDEDEVYVPRTDGHDPTHHHTAAHAQNRITQERVRATSAVMTNIVAGSLFGVLLRRTSSTALANIGAGVVVTQALCFLGYAQVQWKALVRDTFALLFRGDTPPVSPSEAQNRLQRYWKKLLSTLSATIPRRLSFWLGCAGGFLLL